MRIDFINKNVLLKQTHKLQINLTEHEAESIMSSFMRLQEHIGLTPNELRSAAKNLVKASNKKIKLNHALEIMSREFFNLPWHTALPKLEEEHKKYRENIIKNLIEQINHSTNLDNEEIIFIPDVSFDEKRILKEHNPEIKLVSTLSILNQEIDRIYQEYLIRKNTNISNHKIYICVPYFIRNYKYFGSIDELMKTKLWELMRYGRKYNITIMMATSQGFEITQSERTPKEYMPPRTLTSTSF